MLSPIDDVYSGTYGVPGYSISTNSTPILDGGLTPGQEYDPAWLAANGITPHNLPPGFNPIYSAVGEFTGIANDQCFLAETPISMWPTDPSFKPKTDGTWDEELVLSKAWTKPISEIAVGDLVVSCDDKGRIYPGTVNRTTQNHATHILEFWGAGVTPGHAYFCCDGKFKDQHVPLMDIPRTDGAIVRDNGTLIRAATGCEVGSISDQFAQCMS